MILKFAILLELHERNITAVTAVYWVLGDVPSELRSQLTSIYLAPLCKANDVKKKYGYETVLEPLLKDLVTLEKEGIFLPQVGRNVRGTVFCVSADNLGAHSLSGLVESFSAHFICRFCTGDHSDYQQKEVHSGAFPPRTKENYDLHVQSIKENHALVHCCGVKKGCPITGKLSYFHFVTGYPPDVLHDLFEGIIPLELALCLKLLSLFQAKKGAAGERHRAQMSILLQVLKFDPHLFC